MSGGFTPAQQAAITADDGPLGIIAGPGCGKTTALAARLAHLVRERGADPSSILVVTFTAEAARRLRHEVGRQLDTRAADLAIHTLHAFGRIVIDTWPGKFGFLNSSTVVHRDEAHDVLARAAAQLGWDLSSVTPNELASAVDRYRLSDDAAAAVAADPDDALGALAASYEEQLQRRGAIDFRPCSAGRCASYGTTTRCATFYSRLSAGWSSTSARTSRRFSWRWCGCSPRCTAT